MLYDTTRLSSIFDTIKKFWLLPVRPNLICLPLSASRNFKVVFSLLSINKFPLKF